MNKKKRNLWNHLLFWPALIFSWILYLLAINSKLTYWLLAPIAWVADVWPNWLDWLALFLVIPLALFWPIALIVLFIRKSKLKWFLLIFNAYTMMPVITFTMGTADYFKGKAEYFHDEGHIVSIAQYLDIGSNNLAVTLCTKVFGPQKAEKTKEKRMK